MDNRFGAVVVVVETERVDKTKADLENLNYDNMNSQAGNAT